MIELIWTLGSLASLIALILVIWEFARIRRDERELHDVEHELQDVEDEIAQPDELWRKCAERQVKEARKIHTGYLIHGDATEEDFLDEIARERRLPCR